MWNFSPAEFGKAIRVNLRSNVPHLIISNYPLTTFSIPHSRNYSRPLKSQVVVVHCGPMQPIAVPSGLLQSFVMLLCSPLQFFAAPCCPKRSSAVVCYAPLQSVVVHCGLCYAPLRYLVIPINATVELDFLYPRPFVPKNKSSLWRTFVPQERKFPGTFVPGPFRSRELLFPGTFVPIFVCAVL